MAQLGIQYGIQYDIQCHRSALYLYEKARGCCPVYQLLGPFKDERINDCDRVIQTSPANPVNKTINSSRCSGKKKGVNIRLRELIQQSKIFDVFIIPPPCVELLSLTYSLIEVAINNINCNV